jgi:hypothetical protein
MFLFQIDKLPTRNIIQNESAYWNYITQSQKTEVDAMCFSFICAN